MAEDVKIRVSIDSTGAETGARRVNGALQKTGSQAKDAKKSIGSLEHGLSGLQKAAVAAGGALAAYLSFQAIKSATQFALSEFSALDKGLIGVQKTTNATDQEIQEIRKDIQDMALEIPVATESILEIAQAAGQLGVKGTDNIRIFTKTIAQLETATDMAGEQAATQLARLLNVTGENISEVETLGSVIVALGNNMEAAESEITKMATEVGMATAQFTVSSKEAAALGVAMKAMGMRAELGGSVIGRTMREIKAAIQEGGESFEHLQELTRMTEDQIKQTFEENTVKVFQAFVDGLGRDTKNIEQILEDFNLKGQEILKVLPALAQNNEQLGKALGIMAEQQENATALTNESIKAAEAFSSQMRMTWNAVDEVAASVGEGLAPAIVDLTGDFRDWVDENEDFIQQDIPNYIGSIAENTNEYLVDVKNSLISIKEVHDSIPEGVLGGVGLIGASLFGKKIAIFMAAAMLVPKLANTVSGFKAAFSGELDWLEFATMNAEELSEALKKIRGESDLSPLERNFRNLNETMRDGSDSLHDVGGGFSLIGDNASEAAKKTDEAIEAQKKWNDLQRQIKAESWDYGVLPFDIGAAEEQINRIFSGGYAAPEGIGKDVVGLDDQWAEDQMDKADEIEDKWDETYNQMANAFDGWANSYSSTLNDMLWESELTFDGVLESFGKMATQLMIQATMTDIAGALFGEAGGGSEGDSGWIKTALSSVASAIFHGGGVAGESSVPTRQVPAQAFIGAPKLHDGLASNEMAAILKRGETVLTEQQTSAVGNMMGGGNVSVNIENKTGSEVSQESTEPQWDGEKWVVGVVLNAMSKNKMGFRSAMRQGVR